jgi:mannose-6-phosphate isomerase-like protein (cupin superfamily)
VRARAGVLAEARRDRNRQGWGGVTPRFRVAAMVSDPVVVDWTAPPGDGWIAPLHVHHEDDEAWLVLDGALGVRLGERELRIGPGEHAVMPPGTPHTYRNVHEGPTRYLLAMTPRIQRLIDALHAGGDPEEAFREHRSSLEAERPA